MHGTSCYLPIMHLPKQICPNMCKRYGALFTIFDIFHVVSLSIRLTYVQNRIRNYYGLVSKFDARIGAQ